MRHDGWLRPIQAALRLWPWREASLIGAGATLLFMVLGLSDGRIDAIDIVGPFANDLALFFIVGGIGAVSGDRTDADRI